MNRVVLASGFLFTQAVAVVGWWGALLAIPKLRPWFLPREFPEAVLWALASGDLLIVGAGSFVAAFALAKSRSWATMAVLFLSVAVAYAWWLTIGWWWMDPNVWLAPLAMGLAFGGTLLCWKAAP